VPAEKDGKLKYIGGIPYLSSHQIQLEPPRGWSARFAMTYARAVSGWLGSLVLGALLLIAVFGLGALLDLLLF
jgi:hypothetical protein